MRGDTAPSIIAQRQDSTALGDDRDSLSTPVALCIHIPLPFRDGRSRSLVYVQTFRHYELYSHREALYARVGSLSSCNGEEENQFEDNIFLISC